MFETSVKFFVLLAVPRRVQAITLLKSPILHGVWK